MGRPLHGMGQRRHPSPASISDAPDMPCCMARLPAPVPHLPSGGCSDSLTTLAILHESLMRTATADKARISSAFNLAPGALEHSLQLLWPAFEAAKGAARTAALLEVLQVGAGGGGLTRSAARSWRCRRRGWGRGWRHPFNAQLSCPACPRCRRRRPLQELRTQDGDVSYLAPEYRQVLDQQDKAMSGVAASTAGKRTDGRRRCRRHCWR